MKENKASLACSYVYIDSFTALVYGLAPMVDMYVHTADNETKRALAVAHAFTDYMAETFNVYKSSGYNDSVFFTGLDKLSIVYDVYRQLPDFIESVVITAFRHPQQVGLFEVY